MVAWIKRAAKDIGGRLQHRIFMSIRNNIRVSLGRILAGAMVTAALVWVSCPASAEQVANLSGCDVCHGAISLSFQETKDLMGDEIFERFGRIRKNAVVKIDLDGILKPGTGASLDDGFELRIWNNNNVVMIRDLRDKSTIQFVVTAGPSARIYLESSTDNEIDLSDSMDLAWMKFRLSNAYQWVRENGVGQEKKVGQEKDKARWLELLKNRLYWAMDTLG